MHTPDDAVRAVFNLFRSLSGDHVGTTGGKRNSRKTSVKTRAKSADTSGTDPDTDDLGGNDDGEGNAGQAFGNPMRAMWDLIRGGTGGAAVRLPVGLEGQVLAVKDGRVAWVYPSDVGVPVSYITYMDGMTEYDVTDASDVPLWA